METYGPLAVNSPASAFPASYSPDVIDPGDTAVEPLGSQSVPMDEYAGADRGEEGDSDV